MLTLKRRSERSIGDRLVSVVRTQPHSADACSTCSGWHVKEWRAKMKSSGEYVSKACTCACCRFSFAVSSSFGFPVL